MCTYTVLSDVAERALSNDIRTGLLVAYMSVFRTHIPGKALLFPSVFS